MLSSQLPGFKSTTCSFSTYIVYQSRMSNLFSILSDQSRLGISKTNLFKNDL